MNVFALENLRNKNLTCLQLEQKVPDIHQNRYVTSGAEFKLPSVLAAAAQGIECFDCEFYRLSNSDFPPGFTCQQLFDHYINNGQFEGRSYRCLLFLLLIHHIYDKM
jgi:hypothetical protein